MKSNLIKPKFIILTTALSGLLLISSCGQNSDSSGLATDSSAALSNGPYVNQIIELAGTSTCADYSWKNRGRAPAGYVKGIALSFARTLCRQNKPTPLSAILSAGSSENTTKDALAYYQSKFSDSFMPINQAGNEPIRALYTLGMGLGMRESSGTYCEGWDKAAGSDRPSSAGEAGIYQTRFDSMAISPEFSKLYNEYKSSSSTRCFLEVFKEGAYCSSNSTLGTGAGADYQKFNKACPAFAAEYAMTMLRIARTHYGPINRMEAEVVPACGQLLEEVENLIMSDPENACQDIN